MGDWGCWKIENSKKRMEGNGTTDGGKRCRGGENSWDFFGWGDLDG